MTAMTIIPAPKENKSQYANVFSKKLRLAVCILTNLSDLIAAILVSLVCIACTLTALAEALAEALTAFASAADALAHAMLEVSFLPSIIKV